jgi:hypothetical protein
LEISTIIQAFIVTALLLSSISDSKEVVCFLQYVCIYSKEIARTEEH